MMMVVVMKMSDIDQNKVTPMMQQYLKIKNANPDVVLFFRLGDFYEMFFEDAINMSHELELTLTGKDAGLKERIPMCGIPHHAANVYIEKLIQKGYKVGICEQLTDPKQSKGIVERDIIQIISKGTVINSESIKDNDFNYIGSIIDFDHTYSLVYADISTGVIYATLIEHNIPKLISEIVNLGLKEVIVNNKLDNIITNTLKQDFNIVISFFDTNDYTDKYLSLYEDITDIRYLLNIKYLLTYINNTQKRDLSHLQKVIIKKNKDYLKLDLSTKKNLELTETIRQKERNNSLLWVLDQCKTAIGSRTLKNLIERPLLDKKIINQRYNVIETLLKEFIKKEELRNLLYEVYDLERLSGKIAFGNANGKDLLQLKQSLKVLPEIKQILAEISFYDTIETFDELYHLLEISLYENPPLTIKEGYLIKDGYNKELDELKHLRKGGKDFIAEFEKAEKERTGIKNLKVGYNRVFGYYIEISKANNALIKDEYGYERRQTLANCERYISPILKEKEALILNAEERIIELEYNLFVEIREQIKKYIPALQKDAKVIADIDVLSSLATVCEQNNYIRPTLIDNKNIRILNSRHPVVEKVMTNEFVPNDIIIDEETNILLITGPNMAGKSTYMRQLALIIIMAQIGSFVPASEAELPIFDAIYTRIGASDDLVSGESTFMVEMIEANNAITNATENSLILFDELGRGTATFDGMALAQSIIEYIHNHLKAKTLFSTHYHELTDLENNLKGLKNIHVSALEKDGNITFLHKIKEGSVDKSYGIHVAKLAGIKDEITQRANQILKVYENTEKKRDIKVEQCLPLDDLVPKESEIEKRLTTINPLEITPLEALNILYNLKEISNGGKK